MDSLWLKTAERPHFDSLKGDIKTDVLIIGGGITGILCSHKLTRAGVDCVLVEADRICGGITCDTTAKITAAHGLIYDKLIRVFGTETARLYYEANAGALEEYSRMSEDIDCDFLRRDSYVYSCTDRKKLEREVLALEKLGVRASIEEKLPIPVHALGAVKLENQAEFHPLKFAYSVAKDLKIYESTKVLELTPNGAITNCGRIYAEKIVVATHFPFINKHGSYFLKLYQHRSYVLALKGAQDVNGMYVDEKDTGMSFRNYGDTLLLGGGGHRTGKKGGSFTELFEFARVNYPKAEIICKWATQDCMTLDGMPYIGKYSKRTPGMYAATGYNKWGMSSSMVAAGVICDLVLGKDNPFAKVFSPSRSILHPSLALNAAESVIGLITPTTPRCPHLGCALKYNKAEHSWDCPCHGSRFTEDGKLINNPATNDKKKR